LLAGLLSFVPLDAGAEEDTVVAVFPVSTVNLDAGEVLRQSMWAYIEARIAESPGYRVVPHGALEAAIRARHQAYLSQRYDPETQAEVGRQVAASKTVTTRIIRLVDLCKVSVTVFDIARQVSTEAAGAEGPCHERALGESLRVALDELVDGPAPVASAPPLPASTPAAVVLDEGSSAAQPEGEGEPGSLTVGIQPWGGYVGGPYFNGGLTPSEASRFRSDYGLEVRFELLKSIPDSVRAWRAGEVDVLWITVDDLPTEYPQLQPLRPVLFMLTGWSRGEEQLVVRKDIQTLNDLKGKRVALEPKTPAHSFLLISLDLAGLDYDDVTIVSARSSRDAADRFIRGDADAAMVWVDEKEDCLGEVPGAFVLESTKDASFLIAESLVVKAEVLRRNGQALRALAEGWLRANAEINANANGARRRAIEIIESFGKSRRIAEEELRTVRLATHGDNINFFGLNPRYRGEKGQDLFDYFWTRYAAVMPGVMAKPSWGAIADPALVRGLSLRGRQHQPEPMHDFAYCQNPEHQRSLSRKSLQVTFPTNGAKLDEAAKRDIEEKFGHLAEIYFEDCIRLSGNTDSTGRRAYNLELSLKRAEAVKRYLVRRYGFDPRRIITVGHGPDEPVDSNATEAGRARNRRTDFELLH
jgi:NitT/TauT family transport system substrate-binding protein